MGASIVIFPFSLFCFFCFPYFIIARVENCSNNRCSKFEPGILYPFRIKGRQGERCGYQGFDLTCNNMSRTVLELPFSQPFFVQGINYGNNRNEIQLVDPDNCLARRFLKQVNLSGTPFIGIEYKNYSFFSCKAKTNYDLAKGISCLSNSTHHVFATDNTTSAGSSWPHENCTLIRTVLVPVESGKDVYGHPWFAYTNVLHLTWPRKQAPYCKQNVRNERSNFPSFRDPDVPRRGGNIFLIVMGILIPTGMATYLCYIILRSKGFFSGRGTEATSWSSSSELVTIATSLDGSAIKSLPTIVVGESGRLPNPDDNICSICLSEYQPKEALKKMPACNHCFHVDCIDVWLVLNSTCPICRISPVSEKIAIATSQGL